VSRWVSALRLVGDGEVRGRAYAVAGALLRARERVARPKLGDPSRGLQYGFIR